MQGGGGPIANSTVTLWAASANAPSQLAQVATDANGRFEISVEQSPGNDTIRYLIATAGEPAVNKAGGDNPAIALMTVVGSNPPAKVTINEMTTIASVWTHLSSSRAPPSRVRRLRCTSRPAMCLILWTSKPVAMVRPFRTR